MGFLNNTKRTRFKLVVWNNSFFMLAFVLAILKGFDGVAIAIISQIGALTLWYVQSETKRPSIKPQKDGENSEA